MTGLRDSRKQQDPHWVSLIVTLLKYEPLWRKLHLSKRVISCSSHWNKTNKFTPVKAIIQKLLSIIFYNSTILIDEVSRNKLLPSIFKKAADTQSRWQRVISDSVSPLFFLCIKHTHMQLRQWCVSVKAGFLSGARHCWWILHSTTPHTLPVKITTDSYTLTHTQSVTHTNLHAPLHLHVHVGSVSKPGTNS